MSGPTRASIVFQLAELVRRRSRLCILCLTLLSLTCLALFQKEKVADGASVLLTEAKRWMGAANSTVRVLDEVGLLSSLDRSRCNEYLARVFQESDVDVRVLLVSDTSALSIEEFASQKFDEMKIGSQSRGGRGVLLLYDRNGQRLRMEVGYGLEGYLPDAFVGYLTRDHMKAFVESNQIGRGLCLGLRILQHRLRLAVLGNQFDPRVLDVLSKSGHLAGGAGASVAVEQERGTKGLINRAVAGEGPFLFQAGRSVDQTYRRYLEWLATGTLAPKVGIFTDASQRYLASLPMSSGYFEYILFIEYGHAFKLEERDELALLVYTDTPFACPHFFRRTPEGWRMDIVAEVRLAPDVVGGIYTWYLNTVSDDPFIDRFADKLINIKGYTRLTDGDNRPLPVRDASS